MKTTIYTLALAALLPTAALADAPTDLSMHNEGMTRDICPANPSNGAFWPTGIYVDHVGFFVRGMHVEAVAERTDFAVYAMPDHVDLRDTGEIAAFFLSTGFDNFAFPTRRDREQRSEIVVEDTPRGVFDGVPQEWRITSMDGTNTIRVRTLDDRPVELRIGGKVITTVQGIGEGYIDLPVGQKFGGLKLHDAATGEPLRNSTVSTNGEIADLTREVERQYTIRGNAKWSC